MKNHHFRKEEVAFIGDQEVILTKNRLTEKMIACLEALRSALMDEVKQNPFPGIAFPSGKISKGENYAGFPYLVLDYPAVFKKEDIFALRTIFWWGNHISNVFIIKGKYLDHFRSAVIEKTPSLGSKLFFLGETPWLNEVSKEYVESNMVDKEQVKKQINEFGFVKITELYPMEEINRLDTRTLHFLQSIREMIY